MIRMQHSIWLNPKLHDLASFLIGLGHSLFKSHRLQVKVCLHERADPPIRTFMWQTSDCSLNSFVCFDSIKLSLISNGAELGLRMLFFSLQSPLKNSHYCLSRLFLRDPTARERLTQRRSYGSLSGCTRRMLSRTAMNYLPDTCLCFLRESSFCWALWGNCVEIYSLHVVYLVSRPIRLIQNRAPCLLIFISSLWCLFYFLEFIQEWFITGALKFYAAESLCSLRASALNWF